MLQEKKSKRCQRQGNEGCGSKIGTAIGLILQGKGIYIYIYKTLIQIYTYIYLTVVGLLFHYAKRNRIGWMK